MGLLLFAADLVSHLFQEEHRRVCVFVFKCVYVYYCDYI